MSGSQQRWEIKLRFIGNQIATINDVEIIKKIPLLTHSIFQGGEENWDRPVSFGGIVDIKFPKWAWDFVVKNINDYQMSEDKEASISDYYDANKLSPAKLKFILELANFLECQKFANCIAFVAANKIKTWKVDKIKEYMGLEDIKKPENGPVEEDAWLHPPVVEEIVPATAVEDAPGPAPAAPVAAIEDAPGPAPAAPVAAIEDAPGPAPAAPTAVNAPVKE